MSTDHEAVPIELVISDCDGTLLDSAKEVTPRAQQAVDDLREAGIRFTVSSSRPPAGIEWISSLLAISEPMGACNGALMVDPSLHALEETCLDAHDAEAAIEILSRHQVGIWAYSATGWWITDPSSPHVRSEATNLDRTPTVVAGGALPTEGVVKIVGVCDDPATVERARVDLEGALATTVHAACSQDYYLDVTSARASKGTFVTALAHRVGIDPAAICVLGDGRNDVAMFDTAGRSIAMGQATSFVRQRADHVTASNADEGFALGIERFILGS